MSNALSHKAKWSIDKSKHLILSFLLGHKSQWWMVYAMLIVFLLFLYIQTAHCQTTTTTLTPIFNCSFLNNTYFQNAAVANQFIFLNQTSIILIAHYAFALLPLNISTFELGLIYPFSTSNSLVPFPVLFNCASIIQSCQLQTMAGSTSTSRISEAINVRLTEFNYTSTNIPRNQPGLYLRPGQYQLSNCLLNDGQEITDNQTIFSIQILYEKAVGTSCTPSIDTCGSSSLTTCSSSSSTCTCLSTNPLAFYSNASFCVDTLNGTNCTIFPTRCVTWCNSTSNDLCICPIETLKIARNGLYVCELPVNSVNCSSNDNIRRCSYGQSCVNGQCINDILITTTTVKIDQANDSTDQRLRIALGVIAGLLGTSLLVLLGAFCWLRQRQKRRRTNAEKSLSPSSSSATSSLYISPIQQTDQQRKLSSLNTIYHLPIENQTRRFSPLYRTDSFRQAVLSGHQRTNALTEHVSVSQDSLSYSKDDLDSRTYSTLEFTIPSQTTNNQNIYQVILPPSTPSILTHSV